MQVWHPAHIPVAQDCYCITKTQDILKDMRDINDRHLALTERAQNLV